jgi:flagella basal body P-ring formation protein FlgA
MNGQPLSTRKKIQILIAFTILCWATHTLLQQWGRGAELPADPGAVPAPDGPEEKFVPCHYSAGGTLEMRGEASIYGGEVRLKQVCRWSEADAPMFIQVADLVVLRMDEQTSFKPITLDQLRTILRGSGINLGSIHFAGPTLCNVRRSDAQVKDATQTMDQWIESRRGVTAGSALPDSMPRQAIAVPVSLAVTSEPLVAPAPARPAAPVLPPVNVPPVRSLRSLLLNDLSIRVGIPVEQLQVNFNPGDENLLNLSEPQFGFNLEARRVRNLGEIEWEVTVVSSGNARKAQVIATARAWQTQVIANKPLSYRQLIRPDDVSERKTLIDRVSDEPLLSLSECVGQQAAREIKPEMIMTARMVDPVPLAKPGQLITINANQGSIHIRTVARAIEGGSFGQTIRVKNDATNDNYDVVLTGPQEGLIGTSADAARLVPAR